MLGISADSDGNIGLQGSVGESITTNCKPSAAIQGYISITNAPAIKDLEKVDYYGITVPAGIAPDGGLEEHTQYSYTWTLFPINLFDIWDCLYNKNHLRKKKGKGVQCWNE